MNAQEENSSAIRVFQVCFPWPHLLPLSLRHFTLALEDARWVP